MSDEARFVAGVVFLVSLLCVVLVAVALRTSERTDERELLCTTNGYERVVSNGEDYYCVGNNTSRQIIRVNDKCELR